MEFKDITSVPQEIKLQGKIITIGKIKIKDLIAAQNYFCEKKKSELIDHYKRCGVEIDKDLSRQIFDEASDPLYLSSCIDASFEGNFLMASLMLKSYNPDKFETVDQAKDFIDALTIKETNILKNTFEVVSGLNTQDINDDEDDINKEDNKNEETKKNEEQNMI